MKQVIIKQGQAIVENVPAPCVSPDTILLSVTHSCISTGTEMSGVTMSAAPLWKRALKQPENVKKVMQMVATSGIAKTKSFVKGRLEGGAATGYSAAGIVMQVGSNISDIAVGDRVACAGAECAHHAEYINVPRNLTVPLPEQLGLDEASTVTVGAIALQGVRRANPTLGETLVVIGLGLLGQLTVQMLKANGCRVIGVDLDKSRLELASELGLDAAVFPDHDNSIEAAIRITEGIGADGVIITAATPSDEVISTAFKMCRKKGRVVLVGDVGLDLKRADFYKKELDFFISTSYGPGRYDHGYEEEGLDYPVAYVRWTENRNMQAYLQLVVEKKINLAPLISATYSIDNATDAYNDIKTKSPKPLIVLLQYDEKKEFRTSLQTIQTNKLKASNKKLRLAVVGAGGFAKGMHLPNITNLSAEIHLQAIVSRSGHNAQVTAKQFAANYATTDYQQVLNDENVDAVLICTRHDKHAEYTLRALNAGKHVLVEKPLALNRAELQKITDFYNSTANPQAVPLLLVGYNRRFSKYMQKIKSHIVHRTSPMILNYRMNAGYIPRDHWVHDREGGGRNIGEACHIYDLFTFLTDSEVVTINTNVISPKNNYYALNDNFVTSITFKDGTVANLIYTALGNKQYPKEQLEVFVDGKVFVMMDYKKLTVHGAKEKPTKNSVPNKGQYEELKTFANAVKNGGQWPIPLWQLIQTSQISFTVEEQIFPSRCEIHTPALEEFHS